jgi:L-gulonate 5-dehydrogenase
MKAAVLTGRESIVVKDVAEPSPAKGQALVKVAYAGICGTDIHIYRGEFEGRVSYPRILGHEFSGTIKELSEEVDYHQVGQRVVVDTVSGCGRCPACRDGRRSACRQLKLEGVDTDGGFAEYVAVDANRVYAIDDTISLRDASLAEIYAIGVHATRRAGVQPGDFAAIFGCGRVGFSVLECVKRCGVSGVAVVDISDSKLKKAGMVGADYFINPLRDNPQKKVLELTGGVGADVVFECIGDAVEVPGQKPPLAQCAEVMRGGGRIVVLGQGPDEIPLFWKHFVWKEGTIIASRVTLGEFPRALGFMAQNLYHPDIFISGICELEDAQEAFRLACDRGADTLKILLEVAGE